MMPRPSELCQLAAVWNGATVPSAGWYGEEKIDGWRGTAFPGLDGQFGLWTRGGHAINGVGHILHRLSIIESVAGVPLAFDGEFQVGGTLAATKLWCESGWKAGGEAGTYHLFDAMPLSDWQRGGDARPQHERRAWLERIVKDAASHPLSWEFRAGTRGKEPAGPIVELANVFWLESAADVRDTARDVWMRGGEGLMLKCPDAPYTRARSKAWQKVKHPKYVPGQGVPVEYL